MSRWLDVRFGFQMFVLPIRMDRHDDIHIPLTFMTTTSESPAKTSDDRLKMKMSHGVRKQIPKRQRKGAQSFELREGGNILPLISSPDHNCG